MTHEELLNNIDQEIATSDYSGDCYEYSASNHLKALRAVVELHKPSDDPDFLFCWQCTTGYTTIDYPCPTIRTIEKELQ